MNIPLSANPIEVINATVGPWIYCGCAGLLVALGLLREAVRKYERRTPYGWRRRFGDPWWVVPPIMVDGRPMESVSPHVHYFFFPGPAATVLAYEPFTLLPWIVAVVAWLNEGYTCAWGAVIFGVVWRLLTDWHHFDPFWSPARRLSSLVQKFLWSAATTVFWVVNAIILFHMVLILGPLIAGALSELRKRRWY